MWIENVTGDKLGESSLQEELKSGVVLCHLINTISPGLIKAPKNSKMPFMQMENISMYLEGCSKLGVPSFSSFQTVSLYENKDMGSVLNNIQALGSAAQKVPGYSGPTLGAKVADKAPRKFSEAQMRAGANTQTMMGKGSHGGATQAGMSADRQIARGGAAGPPIPEKPAGRRVSGEFSTVAPVKSPVHSNPNAAAYSGGIMAGSNGGANQSGMRQPSIACGTQQGTGPAIFTKFEDAADAQGNVRYGLDRELAEKAAAKYDTGLEGECRMWIENVTGDKLGESSLQEELKNGVVLCNLINTIKPGEIKKVSTSAMPFKQMENISLYLEACRSMGVTDYDLFQTVALFENKDMLAVLTNLQSLGRVAQAIGFQGPTLGAKLASANRRDFTEEQLAAGMYTQTFLGAGSAQGAGERRG